MRWVLLPLTVGSLLLALPGCGNRIASAQQCTEMLDRYIEMVVAEDPGLAHLPPTQAQTARTIKRALKKAEKSYTQVHDQCEKEVHVREYRCAMGAKTANDWEACID